jgi:glycosyltransferase involved in cell wall biosynthesis
MRILFVHAGLTQFAKLHEFINDHTDSTSWLLGSETSWRRNKDKIENLLSFADPKEQTGSYFYTRRLEARVKRSFQIRAAVLKHLETNRIDIIVAHGSGGFPLQLYDELDIPIVSYIEFPSFRAHGHDPRYPPPQSNVYRDKIYEMSNLHQALRSQRVIVPSQHAKTMFPAVLHPNIQVQMDGMEVPEISTTPPQTSEHFRIGFIARDLSSAKGVEHFVTVAKAIHQLRPNCRFLICGSKELRYSYEFDFLAKHKELPPDAKFLDYIFRKEGIDLADGIFQHFDYMSYDDYSVFVDSLDLIHYPLQFGSANWGLFESMFRGKTIIASNRCFIPEVIADGVNGLLCDYGDEEAWVSKTLEIVDNTQAFDHLGENARRDALQRFHVSWRMSCRSTGPARRDSADRRTVSLSLRCA